LQKLGFKETKLIYRATLWYDEKNINMEFRMEKAAKEIIYGYDLFPGILINLIAIILPFVELVAGLFLILGIYPRSAALIINGMLFVFIITLAINFVRGHEFNCGCFSVREIGYINAPEQWIFRDIIYFVLGIYVLLYSKRRRGCIYEVSTRSH
jgi:uncharacterized membrane protein YphA (DoxX/SURF4 family)